MADTIIAAFKRGTELLASFTLLPQYGTWRNFLDRHPWLLWKIEKYEERKTAEKRLAEGFAAGPHPDDDPNRSNDPDGVFKTKTIDEIALERAKPTDEHELASKLGAAIRKTAEDFRNNPKTRYEYEEWVEYTELIRFTKGLREEEEEDEGLIEWDWIGEDSPMMTEQTEPEWLLDRLCESMSRYARRHRTRGKLYREEDQAEQDVSPVADNEKDDLAVDPSSPESSNNGEG